MTYDPNSPQPYDTEPANVPAPSGRPSWIVPAVIAGLGSIVLILLLVLFVGGDDDPPVASPPATSDAASGEEQADEPVTTDSIEPTDDAVDPATTVETQTSNATAPTGAAPGDPATCESYTPNENLPISVCDSGEFVQIIQVALASALNDPNLGADGFFGDSTDAAVRSFQTNFALTVDGIVGPATWETLCPFSNTLCSPDGGDESVEPATIPEGIHINGVRQNILYNCIHYPFQSADGVFDAHIQVSQYLVEDPESGVRRVIGEWIEDETKSLVVSDLSQATVVTTPVNTFEPQFQVTATFNGVESVVSVNAGTDRECDAMLLASSDGSFVAYGVIDVCQTSGVTVITLNTFWDANDQHAYSEMSYRLDDGLSSAQLLLAGDYKDVSSAVHDRTAQNEIVSGSFTDNRGDWTFDLAINQYPGGGHECVNGQLAD